MNSFQLEKLNKYTVIWKFKRSALNLNEFFSVRKTEDYILMHNL